MVKYDIIYVDFPHREHDGTSSRHPALVLDGNRIASLAAQISSKVDKANLPTDYILKDWEDENLDMASVVRLGQQEAFTEESVIFTIGHLTDNDIAGVEEILNNVKKESLQEELIKNTDFVVDLQEICVNTFAQLPELPENVEDDYELNDDDLLEIIGLAKSKIAEDDDLWDSINTICADAIVEYFEKEYKPADVNECLHRENK